MRELDNENIEVTQDGFKLIDRTKPGFYVGLANHPRHEIKFSYLELTITPKES